MNDEELEVLLKDLESDRVERKASISDNVQKLLDVLHRLVDKSNSILVIEHNIFTQEVVDPD